MVIQRHLSVSALWCWDKKATKMSQNYSLFLTALRMTECNLVCRLEQETHLNWTDAKSCWDMSFNDHFVIPVTAYNVSHTAKRSRLIQPKLGCFSCSLVSSCGLAWSTSLLLSLASPFVYTVTQARMSDLLPSNTNYATVDTSML